MLKKAWNIILLIIGAIFFFNGIALAFTSLINFGIILEGLIGFLILLYVFLKVYLKREYIIQNNRWRKIGAIIVIPFMVVFIIAEGLIIYEGNHDETKEADCLIILGAGLRGINLSWTLRERMDIGVKYLEKYPEAIVVVSGGKGYGEVISEAQAMKNYLLRQGIEEKRIFMEEKSTSTFENLKFSKEIIDSVLKTENKRIAVITSDFHMLRAKFLAQRNSFGVYGVPCTTPWPTIISCYLREFFALGKSYVLDR